MPPEYRLYDSDRRHVGVAVMWNELREVVVLVSMVSGLSIASVGVAITIALVALV